MTTKIDQELRLDHPSVKAFPKQSGADKNSVQVKDVSSGTTHPSK